MRTVTVYRKPGTAARRPARRGLLPRPLRHFVVTCQRPFAPAETPPLPADAPALAPWALTPADTPPDEAFPLAPADTPLPPEEPLAFAPADTPPDDEAFPFAPADTPLPELVPFAFTETPMPPEELLPLDPVLPGAALLPEAPDAGP